MKSTEAAEPPRAQARPSVSQQLTDAALKEHGAARRAKRLHLRQQQLTSAAPSAAASPRGDVPAAVPAPRELHSEILTSRRETRQAGHRLMALQRGGRSTGPFSGDTGTQRQRVVGAPWTRAARLSSLGIKAAWTLSEDPRRSCCKRVPSTEPVLLPWPSPHRRWGSSAPALPSARACHFPCLLRDSSVKWGQKGQLPPRLEVARVKHLVYCAWRRNASKKIITTS